MSDMAFASNDTAAWEEQIRTLEEEARRAFLAADLPVLDALWSDRYAVNSPLQQVLEKQRLLELLRSGKIRHSAYTTETEYLGRHGDIVVVMGHDRVADPPDGVISDRRYTNIWQLQEGTWRSIARHAHVVARTPAS
ncbi:MAG: nuclear transport factor 2 family protein [Lysobacterales bacterium]|jgi:hypothetical protein